MGVYPFMFGNVKDFEPIVEEMVKVRTPKQDAGIVTNC